MACLGRFSRLNIRGCINISKSFYTTQTNRLTCNTPSIISTFKPEFSNKNPWIYQQQTNIETPKLPSSIVEISRTIIWNDPTSNKIIEEPLLEINKYEKQAVKLIVIRRHKMRKHKLKKLRKKMKFEWAKRRQRREMRKEKLFQAQLLAQIKEAEGFSAEKYVAEKLRKATEVPIPRYWKGKRLPEFIIREKLGLPPK